MSQHKHPAIVAMTIASSVHSEQLGALRPLISPLQLQHMPLLRLQDMADKSLDLLQAISDALSDWSGAVSRAAQQQPGSGRQPAMSQDEAAELHETSFWLLLAAASLLLCMWKEALCSRVHERQLLGTLGQLLRRVRPSPDGTCSSACCTATVRSLQSRLRITAAVHHVNFGLAGMTCGGMLQTHVRARYIQRPVMPSVPRRRLSPVWRGSSVRLRLGCGSRSLPCRLQAAWRSCTTSSWMSFRGRVGSCVLGRHTVCCSLCVSRCFVAAAAVKHQPWHFLAPPAQPYEVFAGGSCCGFVRRFRGLRCSGVPALHAAATKALSAALQHLTAPRHLGLLLYLPLLAVFSVQPHGAPLQSLA